MTFAQTRITKFDQNGNYVTAFKCEIPWAVYGNSDHFYLSFFEANKLYEDDDASPKLIHKYSADWKHIESYFEPIDLSKFFEDLTSRARRVERVVHTIGYLSIDQNEHIYISYFNPYQINVLSADGKLRLKVFRENDFMSNLDEYVHGHGESYTINTPARSASVLYYQPPGQI